MGKLVKGYRWGSFQMLLLNFTIGLFMSEDKVHLQVGTLMRIRQKWRTKKQGLLTLLALLVDPHLSAPNMMV